MFSPALIASDAIRAQAIAYARSIEFFQISQGTGPVMVRDFAVDGSPVVQIEMANGDRVECWIESGDWYGEF